ncbi:MAG TPA: DUF3662 and FHA domain-containing protein [Thermoleophilia bacterium]|nr:DUF3662 and FHA domain-containing protein [Thermoleophilia bacterium]
MVNIFKGIERKLEGLVEGGFGRAFKASVQPVELAHKLAKEMGDHKTVGVANVYVPNEFDIYLGSEDYAHLSSFADSLKTELGGYVVAFAQREGWTLVSPPRIELREDDDLHLGEFGIGTRTVNEPPSAAPPSPAPVVAAIPVAAPGPVLDQTVLYQAPQAPVTPAAPPLSGLRAALRGEQGQWELRDVVTVIGRSRRCDIVIDDSNVSRQHAEVRRQEDGYVVRDLGSTNGLRVNRRDVKQSALAHGDRIELGTTELLFERLP